MTVSEIDFDHFDLDHFDHRKFHISHKTLEPYCNRSLTDIARYRNSDDPRFAIQNWMRNRNTIEFLGLWESLHNPSFNRVQFDTFRTEAGLNRFVMTPSNVPGT